MVHLFNGSVLILMTRGQTGFEGTSVCYAFETPYEGQTRGLCIQTGINPNLWTFIVYNSTQLDYPE